MDTFSEKELEQLKKLEQLRRLIQTILGAHLRLLIATFVIILIVILVSVYLAAVRSPVRYEATFASCSFSVRFFPEFKAVVVPALQAYSHCASVGRSKTNLVFACNIPMNEVASTA